LFYHESWQNDICSFRAAWVNLRRRCRPIISAADVGWQTPSATVISATGILHDKWKAKVSIKKARKEFESKLAKKIKEDKNLFLHMPETKVKEKSKLDHYKIVRVMTSESKVKAEMLNDFFSTGFTIENVNVNVNRRFL